jgi:hypothetical protein
MSATDLFATNVSERVLRGGRFVVLAREAAPDGSLSCEPPYGRRARGVLGVAHGDVGPGREAKVRVDGVVLCEVAGEVARGDYVSASTDPERAGCAKRAEPGDEIVGLALADADYRDVFVWIGHRGLAPAENT